MPVNAKALGMASGLVAGATLVGICVGLTGKLYDIFVARGT
jgi:hypothetical protein